MSIRNFRPPANDSELARLILAKTTAPLPDFFALLELNLDATPAEVEQAYEQLVKLFDPGRLPPWQSHLVPDAQRLAAALRQARDTLLDDGKRRDYLASLEKMRARHPQPAAAKEPPPPAPQEEPLPQAPGALFSEEEPSPASAPPGASRGPLLVAAGLVALIAGVAFLVNYSLFGSRAPQYPFVKPVGAQVSKDDQTGGFLITRPGGQPLAPADLRLLEASARRSGLAVKALPEGSYQVFPDTPENRQALGAPAPEEQAAPPGPAAEEAAAPDAQGSDEGAAPEAAPSEPAAQ